MTIYTTSYDTTGKPAGIMKEENGIIYFIGLDEMNSDFHQFLKWNEKQATPLDWNTPIAQALEPEQAVFDKPIEEMTASVSGVDAVKIDPTEAVIYLLKEVNALSQQVKILKGIK